jgi:hypothetical protein
METEIVKTENVNIESLISNGITSKADIAVMEKLFVMRNQLKAEKDKEAFYRALAKFQKETPAIEKTKKVFNKDNKTVRYAYAPLETIIKNVKTPLEENGFSYTLKTKQTDKSLTIICEAHHSAGHTESTELTVAVASTGFMAAIQEIGSAITYAKRYCFCNAFGIVTMDEDVDGAGAEKEDIKENKESQIAPVSESDAERKIYEEYYIMLDVAEKDAIKKEFNILTKQDYYDKIPFESIKTQLNMKKEFLAKMAEEKK